MPAKKNKPAQVNEVAALRKELCDELERMRSVFQEINDRYKTNLEADIVSCISTLSQEVEDERPRICSNGKELKSLLLDIKALKLKPAKGRLKDINRIDKLLNHVYSRLND